MKNHQKKPENLQKLQTSARSRKIPATDGYLLMARIYEPEHGLCFDKVIIITSAMGVRQTFYSKFATFLAKEGFTVVSFDYRGIGESRSHNFANMTDSLADWGAKDLTGVIEWVEVQNPSAKITVLGHSVGGQIVGFSPATKRLHGLFLVASQSGYWRLYAKPFRFLMFLLWFVIMPLSTKISGFFPAKFFRLGEDLPRGVANQWARWSRHRDYFLNDGRKRSSEKLYHNEFSGTLTALSFSDDLFAPTLAVDWLIRVYANARSITGNLIAPEQIDLEEIGHFGFFRSQNQSALWLQARNQLLGMHEKYFSKESKGTL